MEDLARLPVWSVLQPGDELAGRFRIVRFLASGGMGEVYDAFDKALETHVALKTVSGDLMDDPAIVEQFRREVQLAQSVTHPNVCRVHDLFLADPPDPMFLTMELIEGDTLAERLRGGALAPARP